MSSLLKELTIWQKLTIEGDKRYIQGSVAPKECPAIFGMGGEGILMGNT